MLWTLIAILIVLWLVGLLANVAAGFIHLLLVAAVLIFLYQLVTGRRTL